MRKELLSGLSTKILPHNFNEILDAMIDGLRKNPINLLPDFPQGGIADCTDYNGGARGGRIRVRARIEKVKKHLLKIIEIPFGTTTTSLIDSILSANDKNKIKIAKIEDNTAEFVEIMVHLPSTVSAEDALPALYAFTDCEVSLAPNACVIQNNHPQFLSVNDIVKSSANLTRELLRQELEINLVNCRKNGISPRLRKFSLRSGFIGTLKRKRLGKESFLRWTRDLNLM